MPVATYTATLMSNKRKSRELAMQTLFLWDAAGLVLAIPLTAGIKAVCDNVASLRQYGKFLGD